MLLNALPLVPEAWVLGQPSDSCVCCQPASGWLCGQQTYPVPAGCGCRPLGCAAVMRRSRALQSELKHQNAMHVFLLGECSCLTSPS